MKPPFDWDDDDLFEDDDFPDDRWYDNWDAVTLGTLALCIIALAYAAGHVLVALSR